VAFYFSQHFTNSALLWGDEWEYQSMAVNFAKGYGLQIHGGLTNFEEYKFMEGSNDYVATFSKQHQYNFYRTPLYPLFIGIIYKIFGVNPYLAKIIQLLLLVFVGAYLPLLAYNFWGKPGFYSGMLSTPIFISLNFKFAGSILTEPFLIFIIFLVIVAFQMHHRRNSIVSALFLGFMLGLSWLTKAIIMPLTLFLFGYYAWKFIRTKNKTILVNTIVIGIMFVLTILPYSVYVNTHSKEFIMISSQGKAAMLDSHNEYVKYGFWGWQWQTDPKSYYHTDDQKESTIKRIVNFYMHYPSLFLKLIKDKITTGFAVLSFFWLLMLCMLADQVRLVILRYVKNKLLIKTYGLLSLVMIITGFLLIFIRLRNQLYFLDNSIFKWLDLMGIVFVPLILILAALYVWNYKKEKAISSPLIFNALILNYVFMIAVTCVPIMETRYVKVIDYIFILLSVHYLLSYIRLVKTTFKTIPDAV
jgi:4-amino-4-deoxy-L-arabinose transferase-like glycosyltransferase